ncbi:MAG: hypothetical protein GX577_12225 [Leptolinea sp.]|nr:hypothetical protein [Leptolinea sp.]
MKKAIFYILVSLSSVCILGLIWFIAFSGFPRGFIEDNNHRKLDFIHQSIEAYKKENNDQYPDSLNELVEKEFLTKEHLFYSSLFDQEAFQYSKPKENNEIYIQAPIAWFESKDEPRFLSLSTDGFKKYSSKCNFIKNEEKRSPNKASEGISRSSASRNPSS